MNDCIVFTTGGTFDVQPADPSVVGEPAAPRLLERGRVTLRVHCIELMRKDSALMTADDRAAIRLAVASCPLDRIVIVHGTDTAAQTMDALRSIPDKVIVLTAAFTPAHADETDAAFNLGGAVIAAQLLGPGVYLSIGGEIYAAGSFIKDPVERRFRRREP